MMTHRDYIRRGNCASVYRGMWCFGKRYHDGDHHALSLVEAKTPRTIKWSTAQAGREAVKSRAKRNRAA